MTKPQNVTIFNSGAI